MYRRRPTYESRFLTGHGNAVEIIKDRFYWVAVTAMPSSDSAVYYHNVDRKYIYEGFFDDFGPLNLGCTYRYIKEMRELLGHMPNKKIVHYTAASVGHLSTNSAMLAVCFMVMELGLSPDECIQRFTDAGYKMNASEFIPYRDATCGECYYQCTIRDCAEGLEYAKKLGWYDMNTFDLRDYQFCEKVENGDFNWIIPEKFIAFAGPLSKDIDAEGYRMCTPELYRESFKQRGVSLVVRLNRKQYDAKRFIQMGMKHVDMYFLDGSCPPTEIWKRFLSIVEKEAGATAIHCKAGLGRTGSLIGCYAMKHFGFPPRGWIGWNRLCRPGSILGPQQQWLSEIAPILYREPGALTQCPEWRRDEILRRNSRDSPKDAIFNTNNLQDKKFYVEDAGQGDRLVNAKARHIGNNPAPSNGNPSNLNALGYVDKKNGGAANPSATLAKSSNNQSSVSSIKNTFSKLLKPY